MADSVFGDAVAARLKPALARVFGRAIELTPRAGAEAVTLTALEVRGPVGEPDREDDNGRSRRLSLRVQISTDPAGEPVGCADVQTTGSVRFGGEDWPIAWIEQLPGGRALLVCIREVSVRRTRPGYTG